MSRRINRALSPLVARRARSLPLDGKKSSLGRIDLDLVECVSAPINNDT